MNLRRFLACSISQAFACTRFLRTPAGGLRILMYHAVGTPALDDQRGLFSINPSLFRVHMQALAAWHAHEVTALTPQTGVNGASRICITFDDGYMDNLEVAAPILAEHKLPFTVFVTSDFVRHTRLGFLTPAALRELATIPGAHIGAHGATHVALSECNDDQLRSELVGSKHYLQDTLGQDITTMAYPYGAANRRVRDAAAAAGYQLAACSLAGINEPSRDRLLLSRTEVTGYDSVGIFRQKLCGDWDWYRKRRQDPACH